MSKEQAEEQAEQELYSRSNAYDLLMSQLPQMYPFDDDQCDSLCADGTSGYRAHADAVLDLWQQ